MAWRTIVDELLPALITIRRQIHRYPELAFQENCTAALVSSTLLHLGLETRTGIAHTGVTGVLPGTGPGVVAVRADMDALPLQEQNDCPYASTVPQVMHACGHDGHVAIALGTAMVLRRLAPLPGSVKFIFQPAEEGPGGALPMVQAGVLENPAVNMLLGFHLTNSLPTGRVGVHYQQACAATDEINITILGQGGHGAHPHTAVDAIVAAAAVVTALQTIVSRQINPLEAAVITIGTIHGGTANNIIADQVTLWGTVRTLSPQVRHAIPALVERLVAGITAAHNASYRFTYKQGYPVLVTDPGVTVLAEQAAAGIVGRDNVLRLSPSMGGEDFAYFAQRVPATFLRIGSGGAEYTLPGHHPRFDFDEQALHTGVCVVVQAVLDSLAQLARTQEKTGP